MEHLPGSGIQVLGNPLHLRNYFANFVQLQVSDINLLLNSIKYNHTLFGGLHLQIY